MAFLLTGKMRIYSSIYFSTFKITADYFSFNRIQHISLQSNSFCYKTNTSKLLTVNTTYCLSLKLHQKTEKKNGRIRRI
jgi:hypothetical protein